MTAVQRVEEGSARYLSQIEPTHMRGFALATAPGGVAKLRALAVATALRGAATPPFVRAESGARPGCRARPRADHDERLERQGRLQLVVKAAGFNLDQKNPHSGPEVSHDADDLLAEYGRLQADAQGIRDQLNALLGTALARQ